MKSNGAAVSTTRAIVLEGPDGRRSWVSADPREISRVAEEQVALGQRVVEITDPKRAMEVTGPRAQEGSDPFSFRR